MISLYLLAAHALGDFVLQTRWQAARKLDDPAVRLEHVLVYLLPFVPVALYETSVPRAAGFLAALALLHFLTDSRRFRSNLGDWLAWQEMTPDARADELTEYRIRHLQVGDYHSAPAMMSLRPSPEQAARAKVPPNPWGPLPILIDQTLHLCQLALIGGLLLR